MNVVFADTSFYVAMGNLNDSVHRKAHAFTEKFFGKVLTTDFVVVETGNFFSRTEDRISFGYLLDYLDKDVNTEVLPATRELLNRGIALYQSRPDKNWSLTDCISFVVMQDHDISEALTADRHFEQAGFISLLA